MNIETLISIIFLPLITVLIGVVGWLLRDKLDVLARTDERLEQKFDHTKEIFDHAKEVLGTKIDGLGKRLDETRWAVIEIQGALQRMGYPSQKPLQAMSPLGVTEYGKTLVDESGFESLFREHQDTILGWVKTLNPQTKYDAQEWSREELLRRKDEPLFHPLKEYAYKKGEPTIENILRAGSIMVRDALIQELGLDIDEKTS